MNIYLRLEDEDGEVTYVDPPMFTDYQDAIDFLIAMKENEEIKTEVAARDAQEEMGAHCTKCEDPVLGDENGLCVNCV